MRESAEVFVYFVLEERTCFCQMSVKRNKVKVQNRGMVIDGARV